MSTNPACPLCAGRSTAWFTKHGDDGAYRVRRCQTCRSAFAWPRPPEAWLRSFYAGQRAADEDESPSRMQPLRSGDRENSLLVDGRRIARRLSAIGASGRLLDVGGGDGWHALALGDAGYDVTVLEPNEERRRACAERSGARCESGFFDARYASQNRGAFDVVLLSQVLEHVGDVGSTARGVHAVLRPGGVAALAVPRFRSALSLLQGRADMFITPPEHLTYITPAGLEARMRQDGFEPVLWETVTWFETARIAQRLGNRRLGGLASRVLRAGFGVADRFGRGNTLEAYYRRT